MAADPELRALALDIVNGLDAAECEQPDRTDCVEGKVWNFFYGHPNGRMRLEQAGHREEVQRLEGRDANGTTLADRHAATFDALQASRTALATAEAERDEARAWVRKMHAETQILTCVYCGHTYPPGTPASGSAALTAHVAVCPKHPLATLRSALVRIEGKLRATLNWHHGNLSGFGWGGDLGKTLYAILDSITTLTCAPAAPPPEVPHG